MRSWPPAARTSRQPAVSSRELRVRERLAGRRRAGVAEGAQPIIPFAEGKGPKDYSIMIGLQLTDEQLAWNRQARGGN